MEMIREILELARWAPSGDNMQTWRFSTEGPRRFTVHGYDTRDHCIYDLQGHASQLAVGALLETISIAAAGRGMRVACERRADDPPGKLTFQAELHPDPAVRPDPLEAHIRTRATQRRPMYTTPLTPDQRRQLEAAVPQPFSVHWVEPPEERRRLAWLLFRSAKIRLTSPEAFPTHQAIIEWRARYSEDRIPDQAVGLDPVATRLMQWAMKSWGRVNFLNTYLGGTLLPRLQLDMLPGIRCAAHFLIHGPNTAGNEEDYIAAGRAWQRFWLQAASLGLWSQPEMTPLIFSEYVRDGVDFSRNQRAVGLAGDVRSGLGAIVGEQVVEHAYVMGRIGIGPAPTARSTRLPLEKLMEP